MTTWVLDVSRYPHTLFPEGYNTEGFVSITALGDSWARFLTPEGKIVDCADFAAQAEAEAQDYTNSLRNRLT